MGNREAVIGEGLLSCCKEGLGRLIKGANPWVLINIQSVSIASTGDHRHDQPIDQSVSQSVSHSIIYLYALGQCHIG